MENLTEHLNCICVFVDYHLLWLIWWEYGANTWLEEKNTNILLSLLSIWQFLKIYMAKNSNELKDEMKDVQISVPQKPY